MADQRRFTSWIVALCLLVCTPGMAATFLVDSTLDDVDVNIGDGSCATVAGLCTLRAAIQEANGLAGTDEITLPAGTYTLALAGADEDAAATGDLDITASMNLNGADAATTIIDGAALDRVLHVHASTTVAISGITVRNGALGGFSIGAGIHNDRANFTINDSVIESNRTTGFNSGGGFGSTGGTSLLQRVTIQGNTGGGGGGVFVNASPALPGLVTFIDSAIVNNASPAAPGGAMIVAGGGSAVLRNVTVSGNTQTNFALEIAFEGALEMSNVTLVDNADTALFVRPPNPPFQPIGGTATVRNSILAGGSAGNCSGTIISGGHNLIQNASGCTITGTTTGNLSGMDPLLAALADNGGSTPTHGFLVGSPAIDAGNPATPGSGGDACLAADQRGEARPLDGDGDMTAVCDIGALETLLINQPPTPVNDLYNVLEDQVLITTDGDGTTTPGDPTDDGVVANDSDPDGDTVSLFVAGGPLTTGSVGSTFLSFDGTFTFTPLADAFGQGSFDYEITDGLANATGTATIDVIPVNDAPTVTPGPSQYFMAGSSGPQAVSNWVAGVDLGPGESAQSVLDFTVIVTDDPNGVVSSADVPNDQSLTFTLTGSSGTAELAVSVQDDGGTANGGMDTSVSEPFFISVDTSADLSVSLSQCEPRIGPTLTQQYFSTVTNNGPDRATGVLLQASVPAQTSFEGSFPGSPDCMENGGTLTCDLGSLDVGQSTLVGLSVQVDPAASGTLSTTSTVFGLETDLQPANDQDTLTTSLVPLVHDDSFESCFGF